MSPRTDPGSWKWPKEREESWTRSSVHQELCFCSYSLGLLWTMSYHWSELKFPFFFFFFRWFVTWSIFPFNVNFIVQEFTRVLIWLSEMNEDPIRALDSWVRGWKKMTQRRKRGEGKWKWGCWCYQKHFITSLKLHYGVYFSVGRRHSYITA